MKAAKQLLRDTGSLDACYGNKLQSWPSGTAETETFEANSPLEVMKRWKA